MAIEAETPARLGYRMPAEWERHAATWIGWPHNRTDWPGKFAAIPWVYCEIVRHLARVERVEILVNDAESEQRAQEMLERAHALTNAVRFHRFPTNRGWIRDFGPLFVVHDSAQDERASVAAIKWHFNGWAKYPDWELDETAGVKILKRLRLRKWRPAISRDGRRRRIVLEGGSIDVNGRGAILATEECLLSPIQQRNPGVSREQLEHCFADYLGARKVLWLDRGIAGDDTHGHIDDTARFVAPGTVVCCAEPNASDPNHEAMEENLRRLRGMTDHDDRPLLVVELPMPAPVFFRGQRLPASYANFYIANGLVLVPTFNDAQDRIALNLFAELFPDREVVGIYCCDLVWGLGTLHCMTLQQPAVAD
ncbi:MAG TPA: agmatine deiminase family protein [Burkholderiales bacterium]|nr:agmatine deiminase family protein [Burkholderiales bacterium]